jgi:hypothetical protein
LIFLESKSDEFDVFDVPSGYCYFAKNRSNLSKTSGGIVIVYKESLTKYCMELNFDYQIHQKSQIENHLVQ